MYRGMVSYSYHLEYMLDGGEGDQIGGSRIYAGGGTYQTLPMEGGD